jgi:hypothetical protein
VGLVWEQGLVPLVLPLLVPLFLVLLVEGVQQNWQVLGRPALE